MLASKYLFKIISTSTHPFYAKLIILKTYCKLRQDYWKHRKIPLLVALIEGTEYSDQLHTSEIHASYEIELENQLSQLKMYYINESKQVPNGQVIVDKINNKFGNYTHMYVLMALLIPQQENQI